VGFLEVWNADGGGAGVVFFAFARPRILKGSPRAGEVGTVCAMGFMLSAPSASEGEATQGPPFPTDILNRVLPNASNSTAQAALASVSSRRGGTWGRRGKFILPQAFAIVMWRGEGPLTTGRRSRAPAAPGPGAERIASPAT